MPRLRPFLLLSLLVLVVVVLAACGSSSGDDSTTSTSPGTTATGGTCTKASITAAIEAEGKAQGTTAKLAQDQDVAQ